MSEPILGLPAIKRAGYPWIEDPAHPLWEEQSNGWPNMTPEEAMRAAVDAHKVGRADSLSHPAFDVGYIANPHATRPVDDEAAAPVKPGREKARR